MTNNRYSRQIILSEIGQAGQDKLSNAKVLVVGAGGLGCPILQYLAAAGIGTLGIIDFDVVEISNLHRQIVFGTSSVGKNKAEVAKHRLEDLNPEISIIAYAEKLTHQNALDLFNQYDIVVDGTDNFETRYLINDACIITNKPLVFGSIYKFEGQVSVFNYQNGPSYRCLFPNPPQKDAVPNCAEIGVLGVLPGIVGTFQANEVLKMVLGIGNILSGKLLCYNALISETSILKLKKSEAQIEKVLKEKHIFHLKHLDSNCDFQSDSISINEVTNFKNAQFVDVRETHEQPKIEGLKIIHIPLNQLENQFNQIDTSKDVFVFCQSGIRSKQAISVLKRLGISNCFSIKEGAPDIISFINTTVQSHSDDR